MPPTVIHVVLSLAHGGLERLVVDWTNERNRRYPGSTFICCLDELGDLAGQVDGNAVTCLNADRSRFPWDAAAVRKLRQLSVASCQLPNRVGQAENNGQRTTDNGQIIIHSHNLAAWQYGVLATLGTGIKHVHTEHGTNPHVRGFRNRLRLIILRHFTDGIVAVSDSTAEAMAVYQKIPRERITVIPNGIDTRRFAIHDSLSAGVSTLREVWTKEERSTTSELRSRLGVPPDAFVVGSVGRLDYVKGYDRLLNAFAGLVKDLSQPPSPKGYDAPGEDRPARSLPIVGRAGGEERKEAGDATDEKRTSNIPRSGTSPTPAPLGRGRTPNIQPIGGRPEIGSQMSENGSQVSGFRFPAFAKLRRGTQVSGLVLLLVGDGPEREALEKQARDQGIGDTVIFAGFQPEPRKYLELMDLFVLPSRSEGLSVALLEAMAADVPVVVTNAGESVEVIDKGRCGVALPEDESRWADILAGLMTEEGEAGSQRMAEAAKARVVSQFSIECMLDEYEGLYRKIAKRQNPDKIEKGGGYCERRSGMERTQPVS